MRASCDDKTFRELVETYGKAEAARRMKCSERNVYARIRRIEAREDRAFNGKARPTDHPARVNLDVLNGTVLVGSDAHIWPGPMTTAMQAFICFAKGLRPRAVILNGDVMDFPQVSRHAPIGWEERPTVADEIAAARSVLEKIEDAAPRNAKLVWTLGNHDSRFESRIASIAPEFAKLYGVHLKDHFSPRWLPCWSAWINSNTVVKHRYKGGAGATRANTLNSGLSMVTGHLHSANVRGLTDYTGTRWGVDTGCLADPSAQAFVDYTEDSPLDWRSGFAVLTFKDGVLLQPELALTFARGVVQFRGQLIEVGQCTNRSAPTSRATRPAARGTRKTLGDTRNRASLRTNRSRPASAKTPRRKR